MIVAVGGAPSSGSTFLADLLDSLPGALCGPELNLFAVRSHFTRFERLSRRSARSAVPSFWHPYGVQLRANRLHAFGASLDLVRRDVRESDSLEEFCGRFFDRFAAMRNVEAHVFFEKSPPNVFCAELLLDAIPEAHFLHVVRDPVYVTKSLRERGAGEALVRSVWPVDVAAAYNLRDHPRCITVRYEDLAADPFGEVSGLGRRFGLAVEPQELAERYRTNRYRRSYSPKPITSWEFRETGTAGNANRKPLTAIDSETAAWLSGSRLHPRFAEIWGLPAVETAELAAAYGYDLAALGTRVPKTAARDRSGSLGFRAVAKWACDQVLERRHSMFGRAHLRPVI